MRLTPFALPLLLAVATATAPAPVLAQKSRPNDRVITSSDSFLSAHPDLRHRLSGLYHYRKDDYAQALSAFRRGARYADKPSQGMLGEMHWDGTGVPVDRALGYVWMDIAAERGYSLMVAKRETYWQAMTESERARALEIGPALFDEYGDEAAKPRLARELRRAKRNVTGSRTGSVGALTIMIPTPSGMEQVDGSAYYDDKFWEPEQYFAWQDQTWEERPRGRVDVGAVITDPAATARADEGAADEAGDADEGADQGRDEGEQP